MKSDLEMSNLTNVKRNFKKVKTRPLMTFNFDGTGKTSIEINRKEFQPVNFSNVSTHRHEEEDTEVSEIKVQLPPVLDNLDEIDPFSMPEILSPKVD